MWLAKVKTNPWQEDWKVFIARQTPESWAQIKANLKDLFDLPDWPEDGNFNRLMQYYSIEGIVTHGDLVRIWNNLQCDVIVSRVRGLFDSDHPDTIKADANRVMAKAVEVNVHVPGALSLWTIKKVEVMEDCCTVELQGKLTDGWRIVAVCPPNDSRRPTYIIGKE